MQFDNKILRSPLWKLICFAQSISRVVFLFDLLAIDVDMIRLVSRSSSSGMFTKPVQSPFFNLQDI